MPIKLILILILVVLVAVLTGFNLSNVCTIWFFHSFENIPVFAALLAAFILGVIVTLPFTIGKRVKANKENSEKKSSGKKRLFGKNKKTAEEEKNVSDENADSNSSAELDVSDPDYVPSKSKDAE